MIRLGAVISQWISAFRCWLAGRGRESEPVSDLHDACMTDLNSIILHAYSLRKIMHEPNWMLGGSICHSELFLSDSPASTTDEVHDLFVISVSKFQI